MLFIFKCKALSIDWIYPSFIENRESKKKKNFTSGLPFPRGLSKFDIRCLPPDMFTARRCKSIKYPYQIMAVLSRISKLKCSVLILIFESIFQAYSYVLNTGAGTIIVWYAALINFQIIFPAARLFCSTFIKIVTGTFI